MRKLCTCGKPVMIIESKPSSDIGTTEIVQNTDFGCLNPKCEKYKIVIDRQRVPITQ